MLTQDPERFPDLSLAVVKLLGPGEYILDQPQAIVRGKKESGTFVRVVDPPVEGMLVRGAQSVDVGDEIDVELLSTNPKRGFIDFGRVG